MSCAGPHETDCAEVLNRVYELLDGEMTEGEIVRFREHLDECSPCLAEYQLDVALKALLRRSCACEPAPETLRTRIMVRITEVRVELGG